jgi:hypothetical protein
MVGTVEKRKQLRRDARERQREVLPRLRAAVRAAKAAKKTRLAKCKAECVAHRARVKAQAAKARELLRERIKLAKEAARSACSSCRVDVGAESLDELNQSLAAVEAERKAIAELRSRAGVLRSDRGRAGGLRAAELRAESDDAVRRDLDDPELVAVWESVRPCVRATPRMSRTEAFLELIHREPELLDEHRARAERQWAAEAEQALGALAVAPQGEPTRWVHELDRADALLASSLAPAPF